MAIQLKDKDDYNTDKLTSTMAEEYSGEEFEKFKGGLGDGTVDIDKINDLPAYTGPTYVPTKGAGVSKQGTRSLVYKIIGLVFLVAVFVALWYGIRYVVSSSGKDITTNLTLAEHEIGLNLGITFSDNPDKVKSVQQYSNGKVTVRSGRGLNIIYIDGKQVGVNTSSREYRFFDVGINEAEKDALDGMTYQYDDSMILINDVMDGESDTYFYYNKKNNDCLVLTVNNRSNRIADMTYYTDFKKVTEKLSGLDD
ncbi:hypothetical protein SAMN02910369_02970 [Lachnospiraceae bacterium NE2001]|nr:hypothetical protein SAMN02910369_02970 [Lachnospiraceae bacterium NE2001]